MRTFFQSLERKPTQPGTGHKNEVAGESGPQKTREKTVRMGMMILSSKCKCQCPGVRPRERCLSRTAEGTSRGRSQPGSCPETEQEVKTPVRDTDCLLCFQQITGMSKALLYPVPPPLWKPVTVMGLQFRHFLSHSQSLPTLH